jgi:hypothetical protein
MKISDLRKLVKIANRLDATGYERLADELDAIVREAAYDPNDPRSHDPNHPHHYESSAAYINYRPEPEYDPDDYCPIHSSRFYRDESGFSVCGDCEWESRQRQGEDAQATPPQATPPQATPNRVPHEYNSETVRHVFKILESNKRLSESQDGQAILKLLEIQGTDWRASDLLDIYAINVSFGSDPRWSLAYNEEFKKAILNIANSF